MAWSVAITSPAASGMPVRIRDSRRSAACEHRGHPLPARVQGGAPRVRDHVLGQRGADPGLDLVAGPGAPAGVAGVGQEQHRPHHPVAQGGAVAVGVVRRAAPHPVVVGLVADERDRGGVGAERGAGEGEAPGGRAERLRDRVAPAQRVPAVVHLVEDDQRAAGLGAVAVQRRQRGHLGVGDGDAEEVPARRAHPVAVLGVQRDPHLVRGLGPLPLEVLGGRDHRDRGDLAGVEQLAGDLQREGRLAGAGGGDREEVPRLAVSR